MYSKLLCNKKKHKQFLYNRRSVKIHKRRIINLNYDKMESQTASHYLKFNQMPYLSSYSLLEPGKRSDPLIGTNCINQIILAK